MMWAKGLAVAAATLCLASACTVGGADPDADYDRDPYKNDRVIDAGLSRAQDGFVKALSKGKSSTIAGQYTAMRDQFGHSMAHVVAGYEGHPTKTLRRMPGDDATADQIVAVTCAPGRVQSLDIAWAWFDGAWRAWPADQDKPYPGC